MAAGTAATVLAVGVAVGVLRDVLVAVVLAALLAGPQLHNLDVLARGVVAVLAAQGAGVGRGPVLLALARVALPSLYTLNVFHGCSTDPELWKTMQFNSSCLCSNRSNIVSLAHQASKRNRRCS